MSQTLQTKLLLYGEPGCGKTHYWANAKTGILSIPEAGPVLLLDFDNKVQGVRSTINTLPEGEFDWKTVREDKINRISFAYTSSTIRQTEAKIQEVLDALEDSPFKTIVIDSATSLSEFYKVWVLKTSGNKRANEDVLSKQDYNVAGEKQNKVINDIINSGKHAILVCHIYKDKTESGIILKEGPAFIGQVARNSIPGKMDFGCYMFVNDSGERELQWESANGGKRWVLQSIELGVDEPLSTKADFSLLAPLFSREAI